MPRIKSHGSGSPIHTHNSSGGPLSLLASHTSPAFKLVVSFMVGCVVLLAVYMPGHGSGGGDGSKDTSSPHNLQHSSFAVDSPPKADPLSPSSPPSSRLFPTDFQLLTLEGQLVNANEALKGKSVGLYVGAGWCPMTRAADPGVAAWVLPKAEEVALVYVSSDNDEKSLVKEQKANKWPYAIPFSSPFRSSLKQQYKVWSMHEDAQFKGNRVSGIPTMVVVDAEGKSLAHLDIGTQGVDLLEEEWKYTDPAWQWP